MANVLMEAFVELSEAHKQRLKCGASKKTRCNGWMIFSNSIGIWCVDADLNDFEFPNLESAVEFCEMNKSFGFVPSTVHCGIYGATA